MRVNAPVTVTGPARLGFGPGETSYAFALALCGGDATAAIACFSAAARIVTADGTEVSGRAAVRGVLEQIASPETKLEIKVGRTVLAGPVALSTQFWRRTSSAAGEVFEKSTTASLVLEQRDGRWAILIASPWGR
jgi:ketosteroid isomerase-like protein